MAWSNKFKFLVSGWPIGAIVQLQEEGKITVKSAREIDRIYLDRAEKIWDFSVNHNLLISYDYNEQVQWLRSEFELCEQKGLLK